MPRPDPVSEFDSFLIQAAKILACVAALIFVGVVYFRVLIPGVWELGDLGKVGAVALFCTFVVLFATIIVIARRILIPTQKEEKTNVEEDRDG